MLKELLLNFLPWILFFLLSGSTHSQLNFAIIIATITACIFEFKGLKKLFILSWGTAIFFIFMLFMVVILNNQWVEKHTWIFSNGTLALIAWGSLLLGKPFTIQYAKEFVSKEKWNHPMFIEINYCLTRVWGLIFLCGIVLHILKIYYPHFTGWTFEILTYIPSIFGIWFTGRFPKWYRKKKAVIK